MTQIQVLYLTINITSNFGLNISNIENNVIYTNLRVIETKSRKQVTECFEEDPHTSSRLVLDNILYHFLEWNKTAWGSF